MGNQEARRQADIVSWIRANVPDVVVYAVLNDGLYSKSDAAKRRWMGLLAGVPDLALIYPGGAVFLEVKAPGCKPSEDQLTMFAELERLGARCGVCRSVDEARELLTAWGIFHDSQTEVAA